MLEYSFVQISDIHYDKDYSANGNEFCHNEEKEAEDVEVGVEEDELTSLQKKNSYRYGRPGSDCDSPLILIEKSLAAVHNLDPDIVFWTGDSSRHDRDYKLPRHPLDVVQGIKRVAGIVNSAFRVGTVWPTIGNWDTKINNKPSLDDYQTLYHIWSILWNERQRQEIKVTFLEGGYYSLKPNSDFSIISLNTVEWYVENVIGDCRRHNQQLEWLQSILEEGRVLGESFFVIGHIPPVNYLGAPLYHARCLSAFTNLIGRYSEQIIAQYYGHVNRDLAYLTTKQVDGSFQIVPLTQSSLSSDITDMDVVGQMFTGSSVVPYFYPSFRWGQIGIKDAVPVILEHVQFYAPIDSIDAKNETEPFFRESCRTHALSMNGVTPLDWKLLSSSIQQEIKVSGSSSLAKYYWECSTVHYNALYVPSNAANSSDVTYLTFIVQLIFGGLLFVTLKRKCRIIYKRAAPIQLR